MTVVTVAYPLMPVGPGSGGGAEQIAYLLERAIHSAGHRSIVIAASGSQVAGELMETAAFEGEIDDAIRARAQQAHRAAIVKVLSEASVDIIHFHGLDFFSYVPDTRAAMVATLHLPVGWYPKEIFGLRSVTLVSVSNTQANSAPSEASIAVVHNGVEVDRYAAAQPGEYLLWLGRICPEKGVHIALEVAHRLDLPILIAGPVHPFRAHLEYFASCVKPLLGPKCIYLGPVNLQKKIDLFARARCLLIPSLAPETSSLIAMEAAASGVPAVGFASGALPEIIEHGRTGFIANSADEMVMYTRKSREISPEVCRARARERFAADRMRRDYLALYRRLMQRRDLGISSAPHSVL
jgi:glycosyltransferase involved in cell wall biosynthesis